MKLESSTRFIHLLRETQSKLIEHIEEFAAAFLKKHAGENIDPDKVIMVIETTYAENKIVHKIYFTRKDEVK